MRFSFSFCLLILLAFASRAGFAQPPLVFVHGIKGSTLIDPSNGQMHWLTRWQVLGFGTQPLALPLTWDRSEEQGRDGLAPGSVLESVPVVPYLYEEKIYGPWLEAARDFGRPFYPFAYDWRRDALENAAQLESFLSEVAAKNGGQKIPVVSHSMGGLITLAVLNRRPELFESVFFAGVPFGGGIGFLPDLTVGVSTGLNRRILSPEVLGTFPSVYIFFPLDGSGALDSAGKPVALDFFAAADWKKYGWGLFNNKVHPEAKEKFLNTALEHAKKFRSLMVGAKITYPPIWVIASREHATLAEITHAKKSWDFDIRPKLPGDGRVCEKHALPPEGIPYHIQFTEADHAGLLNDPKIIALIRNSVL